MKSGSRAESQDSEDVSKGWASMRFGIRQPKSGKHVAQRRVTVEAWQENAGSVELTRSSFG